VGRVVETPVPTDDRLGLRLPPDSLDDPSEDKLPRSGVDRSDTADSAGKARLSKTPTFSLPLEPRGVQGERSRRVPSRANRPLVLALLVDLTQEEVDRSLDPWTRELVIPNREHQPLEHVPRGLHFAFLVGIVATPFVPAGAEAAVRILKCPCVGDVFFDKTRRSQILPS
jgi:hypothetical protein